MLRSKKRICAGAEKVVIFFAVNNTYAPYLGVTLASLVQQAKSEREYELVILYHDLSERNRDLLKHIVEQVERKDAGCFRLRFKGVSINGADYKFAHGYKPLSIETWYRLFAPSLFPEYDKMLWLDSDVLVRADVAELYATDMGDNWIAACRWDYGIIWLLEHERKQKISTMKNYFAKTLKIKKPKEDYVNAGVLLMNLRALREQNVQGKFLQAAQNRKMYFHDQCVINMICHDHIHYIDSVWNGLISYDINELPLKYRKKALADREERKIIHWAGRRKPWNLPHYEASEEWWSYARKLPYYEEILYTNIYAILHGEMDKKLGSVPQHY